LLAVPPSSFAVNQGCRLMRGRGAFALVEGECAPGDLELRQVLGGGG
jgi:hypothetical protein